MVQEPIYLDLSSSSDEDDEENNRSRDGPTALLYLAKVFNMDVDDDDVRIIDKPASHGKVKRDRARMVRGTLDDDDCCILDTDPGAADAVPDAVSSHNTDELVMTGEKGPVACRDFPHARYLCVHFPFKSTLHSNYCAQCHCYVCDSLAPCSLWGEGNSPKDHCHASEEPSWKSLRKIAKRSLSSVTDPTTRASDPAEESRLVQSTISQTLPSCALPITPVTPVDPPGAALRVPTTVKRDPLVIHLKGKGRGKVSQPPQLLGVKNVRCKTNLKKSAPGCLVPRSTPPSPLGFTEDEPPLRTTPLPTYRLRRSKGTVPSIITPHPEPPLITPSPNSRPGRPVPATPSSHSQPPHTTTPNPNFRPGRAGGEISPSTSPLPQSPLDTPYPNFRRRRAGGGPVPTTVPNPNFRLGRAVPSTTIPRSRSTRSLNSLPNRAVAASLPHRGPSRAGGVATRNPTVQQLPQPTLISNSAPTVAATSYIPLPPVTMNDLQAPSVSAGPPQRYVSAGPLRDQQVSDPGSMDPLSEGHSNAQPQWPRADFVAHDSRTAVDNASSSRGRGTVDILAGPIEGWEMDAAADFTSLTPEQVPSSLNDVMQQMAADDYLWEPPYPGWQ